MRRILIAAAAAAAAAAYTPAPAAAQAAPGDAYLRGFACHRSLDAGKRMVSVTAVMGTVARAAHLKMRFTLQERRGRSIGFVRGGDLGHWISPAAPTLGQHPSDQWVVNHPVTGVPVPASYRFRVTFRWIAASGQTIGQTQKTSPTCGQPDMRPDLYVRLLSSSALASGNQYNVEVGNDGLSGASNVELRFASGAGGQPQTVTIARLAAHATAERTFVGPVCTPSSTPATISVDPNDLIDVLSRAENTISAPCPSS